MATSNSESDMASSVGHLAGQWCADVRHLQFAAIALTT